MTEELAVPAIVRSVGAMAIEAPGSVGALLVTLVVNVALQITTSALGAEGGVLRMVMLTSTDSAYLSGAAAWSLVSSLYQSALTFLS